MIASNISAFRWPDVKQGQLLMQPKPVTSPVKKYSKIKRNNMHKNTYSVWLWCNTKTIKPIRIGYGLHTKEAAMEWASHVNGAFIITSEDEDGFLTIVETQS